MNTHILDQEVQEYISRHLNDDVHKIAMAKSSFKDVEAKELANQIAAKNKSQRKLPTWYYADNIYYPALLSIEQCSSEITAYYKAGLLIGDSLIDLTGGFGVDSFYFAKKAITVTHCEINTELSEIAGHNARILGQKNISFFAGDGLAWLQETNLTFDTIYIDPARRNTAGKVFMLKDCKPNVVEHLDLLIARSKRIILKTAPLLDLSAGLKELKNVTEIHIVSTKNEVKELLWVIEKGNTSKLHIVCVTLNEQQKTFSFFKGEDEAEVEQPYTPLQQYLYEPDVALLKGGAFNLIANRYQLNKLHPQTQLYTSNLIIHEFPGRRFKINKILSAAELKKEKGIKANVIARSYYEKAEVLVKKYKLSPDHDRFLIFSQSKIEGYLIIDATIEQHY